jgi:16S rRNA (cytosine1402-N4)-methyltransferase
MEKLDHIPVLLNEVIEVLNPTNDKIYVDATFGAGGYTKAILEKASCKVIGIDCDQSTEVYANNFKSTFEDRFNFINKNFQEIDIILNELNISKIDGIIFDLGVSSMQLDNRERGFSFSGDGPLDMRMDSSLPTSATHLINSLYEEELANLIYELGGERKSRIIAKNIVKFRQKDKIKSTSELVEAIGINRYSDKLHFATKTFQALRIAVNNELENIELALNKLPPLLAPGGIICVVSFHSSEDRIVKKFFTDLSAKENFEKINKKVITPLYKEIRNNPRARSAKLRALRKIV